MAVYAYICNRCDHPVAEHRLMPDAPSVEGPYACRLCDCEMKQSDPQRAVDREGYRLLVFGGAS